MFDYYAMLQRLNEAALLACEREYLDPDAAEPDEEDDDDRDFDP